MGRKKGFDNKKIGIILGVLAANPDGLWLRQLAVRTRLSPATVKHYIDTVIPSLVEDQSLGQEGRTILRVIRIKPFVLQKLQEGQDLNQIMKLIKIIDSVGK